MKILFFSQFYLPESIAPAFRASENAQIWAKNGNDVTVFTGYPNYPVGKIFDGYSPKLLFKEDVKKVHLIRNKLVAKTSKTIISRLENALSYYFYGRVNFLFNKRKIGKDYDVVLGTSGLVFNAMLARTYARKIKKPFIVEFRDLTYKQMIATGKRENSFPVKVMRRLELGLCKKSDKIVTVTKGFKQILIDEGIPEEKIDVITNGVDSKIREARKDDDVLRIGYFGTLGISQNLSDTFKYAEAIESAYGKMEYLIIGEGAQKQNLIEISKEKKYLRLLDGMPQTKLEPYYSEIDLAVITLRKSDSFRYTIPSKVFQCMGRGVPVLFIGPEGEAAEIIRNSNAGIILSGSEDEDYTVLFDFFKGDVKAKLSVMGKNGYECVKNEYSRSELAQNYLDIMTNTIANC